MIRNSRPAWRKFEVHNTEMSAADAHMSKMRMADLLEREPTIRIVYIPYYWPVLVYVATWLVTLAWWLRRKSRILKLHAAS